MITERDFGGLRLKTDLGLGTINDFSLALVQTPF
jgi:hypothetical protein